jgi:hypothetical protein
VVAPLVGAVASVVVASVVVASVVVASVVAAVSDTPVSDALPGLQARGRRATKKVHRCARDTYRS